MSPGYTVCVYIMFHIAVAISVINQAANVNVIAFLHLSLKKNEVLYDCV